MSALEQAVVSRCHADETEARLGLIIPSSNRMTEPQFHRYAPKGIAVHVARAQITGRHQRPVAALLDEVGRAASSLADARCDPVIFHCTGTAMAEGAAGEKALVRRVVEETGATVFSTAQAIVEALSALALRRVILISPYAQEVNDHERDFLAEHGIGVACDVALGLKSDDFIRVPVQTWIEIARRHAGSEADGYFLSCTNTTQIEAIETIERESGKPVINSNQATLWAALRRIGGTQPPPIPGLGRLFRQAALSTS
ncbi:MAG: aspartate/glutamate racemase family protein [Hyphomicrobiales bacterium]|nr:aspartate/glutamate racemase family protein [Hyphomicrobiales bacterium]